MRSCDEKSCSRRRCPYRCFWACARTTTATRRQIWRQEVCPHVSRRSQFDPCSGARPPSSHYQLCPLSLLQPANPSFNRQYIQKEGAAAPPSTKLVLGLQDFANPMNYACIARLSETIEISFESLRKLVHRLEQRCCGPKQEEREKHGMQLRSRQKQQGKGKQNATTSPAAAARNNPKRVPGGALARRRRLYQPQSPPRFGPPRAKRKCGDADEDWRVLRNLKAGGGQSREYSTTMASSTFCILAPSDA